MKMFDEPLSGFLIATNVILGLFVLGCVLVVLRTLLREVVLRRHARSLAVTSLGVTMADGGQCAEPEGHLSIAGNGKIRPENDKTPASPS
jgi:hypothetical protein